MSFIQSASPETLRAYRVDLRQAFGVEWQPFEDFSRHQGHPPRLSDEALLAACREALSRWAHFSPATRNRKAACLKGFLGWLHQEGALERDLSALIPSPKVPHRLPHHLSVDEALALFDSIRVDLANASTSIEAETGRRDRALLLLLYGGGLRVSEACGLKWSSVDARGRLLRVSGKGGKERLVAIPDTVAEALAQAQKERGAGEFVFGDEPLSTRKAHEIVRARGVRAGLLKPLHPHALRHSFATHLLSGGASLRALQELLGHRTLQATQRYTHLGIDQLARTLEAHHPLGSSARRKS